MASISDTIHFISALTPQKTWNAAKVTGSYFLSRWTSRPVQWGRPFNMAIEPTTDCNLGCPECPSGLKAFTRPTGRIDEGLYRKLLDQMGNYLIYLYFYFQGEPYLHPDFEKLVSLASAKRIYTVTSTNAHFLSPKRAKQTVRSGLSRIIISIDGTSQEVYEQYRKNGRLSRVLQGARNLVEARSAARSKKPHIIFQFLVVKPNEHQIEEVYTLADEIGVDEVRLKSAQIYDYENGHDLIPSIAQYSRYSQVEDGSYRIKNEWLNHCWKLWHSCVVTWDGNVVPCCFDKDADHRLGDLNRQSFDDVWQSKAYRSFRKKILESRASIDMCKNCTEGTKVWV